MAEYEAKGGNIHREVKSKSFTWKGLKVIITDDPDHCSYIINLKKGGYMVADIIDRGTKLGHWRAVFKLADRRLNK